MDIYPAAVYISNAYAFGGRAFDAESCKDRLVADAFRYIHLNGKPRWSNAKYYSELGYVLYEESTWDCTLCDTGVQPDGLLKIGMK